MNIILACDSKFGIGKNNTLPNWNIKGDLKRFKDITTGSGNNVVIMGRKTYESLPRFPLIGRYNIVISRSMKSCLSCPNVAIDLDEAYSLAKKLMGNIKGEIWVIGGASLYNEVIKRDLVKYADITQVIGDFDCDVFLSDESIQWIQRGENNMNYIVIRND